MGCALEGQVRNGLFAGGNRIRTIGPASGKVVDAKFRRSAPGRSNTDIGRVLSLPWRAETSNSRSRRKTSVLRPMISPRSARIDDNLGRGTDGSNPVPSSAEPAANFAFGREASNGPRKRQGTIPRS